MNKSVLVILGVSVCITILVSTLFGLAGSTIAGTFWGWFWISILTQFLLFGFVNSFLIQRDNAINSKLELETLDAISKFTIKISCAYCQQFNVVPIQLNQKNTFKCESCNQINGISMQFMATTLTTPLETVKIPVDENTNTNSIEFKSIK
jgi:hypothetical protein